MNDDTEIHFRSPALIRKAGMDALVKELGIVGAIYFMRQFSTGQGDYTAERETLLAGITLDEIIEHVREIDQK